MNKELCKNGHEYTEENSIILKNGKKRCRACQNKRDREWRRKMGLTAVKLCPLLDPAFDDFGWFNE